VVKVPEGQLEGVSPDQPSPATRLGSAVHRALDRQTSLGFPLLSLCFARTMKLAPESASRALDVSWSRSQPARSCMAVVRASRPDWLRIETLCHGGADVSQARRMPSKD
jgi:hypothetical protein